MNATFLQPSGTAIAWTGQQYQREIALERAVGITGMEKTADQLYGLHGSATAFKGWYVPFEVSDR